MVGRCCLLCAESWQARMVCAHGVSHFLMRRYDYFLVREPLQSHCNQTRQRNTMRRIVAVATVAAARAQLDAAGHAAAAPARRDPIDTTPGLRGGAAPAAASIQKEDEDYSACTTVAAELAFARLEIAALQHDNAVLASENRVLANARNLPEVVADVREYIRHVVDGDDAVPCKPEV